VLFEYFATYFIYSVTYLCNSGKFQWKCQKSVLENVENFIWNFINSFHWKFHPTSPPSGRPSPRRGNDRTKRRSAIFIFLEFAVLFNRRFCRWIGRFCVLLLFFCRRFSGYCRHTNVLLIFRSFCILLPLVFCRKAGVRFVSLNRCLGDGGFLGMFLVVVFRFRWGRCRLTPRR